MADAPPNAAPLLCDFRALSELTSIPRRTLEQLHACQRIGPESIKLGVRRYWRTADIRRWVELGCPNRERWLALIGGDQAAEEAV